MFNSFTSMKLVLRKFLPQNFVSSLRAFKVKFIDGYSSKSYSQDGADYILRNYFSKVKNGFYVDVGAHHPKKYSMTQVFYEKGWSGINIDAMPGSMKSFSKARSRDINLEFAVSGEEKELTFYIANEPALNSLDSTHSTVDIANRKNNSSKFKITQEVKVKSLPLERVLEDFLPPGRSISLLSVDVEGVDLEVLKSNDWSRFRPTCIVVESLQSNLDEVMADPIYIYLKQQGYSPIAKTLDNLIFEDSNQLGKFG